MTRCKNTRKLFYTADRDAFLVNQLQPFAHHLVSLMGKGFLGQWRRQKISARAGGLNSP